MVFKRGHDVIGANGDRAKMPEVRKVPLHTINDQITCSLCKGYFVDATTIIECLHTFCRSCIVKYLETHKYCPVCDVLVHKSRPLTNIRPDKTMQDIVYKLVPRLYRDEMFRRKEFYVSHPDSAPSILEERNELLYDYILTPEDNICISLSYYESTALPRYLKCPSAVTIGHLRRLIAGKYELSDTHHVDVYYNEDCLHSYLTLMEVAYIYSWRRIGPLELTYRIFENRAKRLKPTDEDTSPVANNNNNNWKEVQLRISENGEISVTGIQERVEDDFVIKASSNEPATPNKVSKAKVKKHNRKNHKNNNLKGVLESKNEEPTVKDTGLDERMEVAAEPDETKSKTDKENGNKTPKRTDVEQSCLKKSKSTIDTGQNPVEKGKNSTKKLNLTKLARRGSAKLKTNLNLVKTVKKDDEVVEKVEETKVEEKEDESKIEKEEPSKSTDEGGNPPTVNEKPEVKTNSTNESSDSSKTEETLEKPEDKPPSNHIDEDKPVKAEDPKEKDPVSKEPNRVEDDIKKDKEKPEVAKKAVIATSIYPISGVKTTSASSMSNKRKLEEKSEYEPQAKQPTILNHTLGLQNLSNNHPLKKHSMSTAQNSKWVNKPSTPSPPCYVPRTTIYNPIINVPKPQTSAQKLEAKPKENTKNTPATTILNSKVPMKNKPGAPIGYRTLRDPPKNWNPQLTRPILNRGATTDGKGVELKNVRPPKFFKIRNNMPRYLGNPASGVKPMYQVHSSPEKEKSEKSDKTEIIKKHSIVKIDPKTLKPISERAPETSNLTRTTSDHVDLKINTSSVSIFNPLKLQSSSSPKSSDRKSPKSPNKILNFTPPNPFIPNLQSPTISPNQFLFPGPFNSYDPRMMAAYHSFLYGQSRLPFVNHLTGINAELNRKNYEMQKLQQVATIPSTSTTTSTSSIKTGVMTAKKIKEKTEKSLQNAVEKLTQNKLKENKEKSGNNNEEAVIRNGESRIETVELTQKENVTKNSTSEDGNKAKENEAKESK